MSGAKIRGAAPASAYIDFYVEVPAIKIDDTYVPDSVYIPIIQGGTIIASNTGVRFELGEDINFGKKDIKGNLIANYVVRTQDSDGNDTSYTMVLRALCKSGLTSTETFMIPNEAKPFRTIRLSAGNVNEILSVQDSENNTYYEVEALTQDVVYQRVINTGPDSDLTPENIELLPAPYRYITSMSKRTGKTSIRFGAGNADTFDNDIIPDPSEVAIPLFGSKQTFSRFTIDPNSLLQTRTLGVSPKNTTLTVKYRAGGGLSHNVSANQITAVKTLLMKFNSSASPSVSMGVRSSLEVNNAASAFGGEAPPTLDELKLIALSYKNAQSRIVTKQDLIVRIYTMPPNFGRAFRVGMRSNPFNPQSSVVSIVSRDLNGKLIVSDDSLKDNVQTYINEFRLISDAIDIVDAKIINLALSYTIVADSVTNKNLVIQKINTSLAAYMRVENFQIDQPLVLSDLYNIIINTGGIVSLVDFTVENRSGEYDSRAYSPYSFSIEYNTDRGIVIPDAGSIFELKFPNDDIQGSAR